MFKESLFLIVFCLSNQLISSEQRKRLPFFASLPECNVKLALCIKDKAIYHDACFGPLDAEDITKFSKQGRCSICKSIQLMHGLSIKDCELFGAKVKEDTSCIICGKRVW